MIGGETLTVTVLLAGFAVARRNGLWAAIGVAVGRLLIPVYYALISPRRNPFNAFFHPVTLGGCILVILAAAVGLGSAGTLPPRSAPVPASV